MAAAIWIVRANKPPHTLVNGIDVVFGNFDDADSEAVVLADCEAAIVASGVDLPVGYFVSADLALAAGQLDADEDLVYASDRIEVIA